MAKKIKISLAAARINANMLQSDTAKEMNVTPNTVSNWETGKTAPTVLQMQKMCQIYKMPFDFVYVPEVSK